MVGECERIIKKLLRVTKLSYFGVSGTGAFFGLLGLGEGTSRRFTELS